MPLVSEGGMVYTEGNGIGLDTTINLALKFEGDFNEMAHQYMQWRKSKGFKQ